MKSQNLSRRDFLKLAGLTAASASLVACGVNPNAASGIPTVAASQSGTLTIWGWEGTFEGMQAQVPAFNKLYPNIKVEFKTLGYDDTHTNLQNAIIAGTGAPDICPIDVPYLSKMSDGLVDLSSVADQYKNDFVIPTYSAGSLGGKFYGIATDSEPMGLMYRKDIWDQYGIKEDDIKTWDDLIAVGNKLAKDSGGSVKLYHMNSDNEELFSMLAIEQGFQGIYFSADDKTVILEDPKIIEAAAVLKRMWDGDGVQKNPVGGAYAEEVTTLLKNSKLASQIVGPAWYPIILNGSMPELSGKWQLMRAPAIKAGGSRSPYMWPTIIVMPKQSKLQGAAWDLMRMGLIGDGAKVLYEKGHILPAYKPLLDQIQNDADPYFGGQQINKLWAEIAKDCPPMTYGVGLDEARKIVGQHLNDLLTGGKTPEQAMKEAAQEIRTKLKKA